MPICVESCPEKINLAETSVLYENMMAIDTNLKGLAKAQKHKIVERRHLEEANNITVGMFEKKLHPMHEVLQQQQESLDSQSLVLQKQQDSLDSQSLVLQKQQDSLDSQSVALQQLHAALEKQSAMIAMLAKKLETQQQVEKKKENDDEEDDDTKEGM